MSTPFPPVLDQETSRPPLRLFLIDSVGAFLTALLTGLVLAKLEFIFGMPQKPLRYMAIIALAFSVYSMACHLFVGQNWRPFLKAIAFANLVYCGLTIGLLYYFYLSLSIWGWGYFLGEIMIIGSLAYLELKIARN